MTVGESLLGTLDGADGRGERVPDPYDPDYRPEYRGPDETLGDVGSGSRFGVDLYHLYYAGRQRLPHIADLYATMTEQVHRTQSYSRAEFTRPNGGLHPAHALWMELRDELQEILRQSAINFWDTGVALVQTANDYARTDEEAARAFANTLEKSEGVFPITELPPAPNPPAPGDHRPLPPRPGEEPGGEPLPPPPGEAPGDQERSSLPPPPGETE